MNWYKKSSDSSIPPSEAAEILYKFFVKSFSSKNGGIVPGYIIEYFNWFAALINEAAKKVKDGIPIGTEGWRKDDVTRILNACADFEKSMRENGISYDLVVAAKPKFEEEYEKYDEPSFYRKYGFSFEQYNIISKTLASMEDSKNLLDYLRSSLISHRKVKNQGDTTKYIYCTESREDIEEVKRKFYEEFKIFLNINVTFDDHDVPTYCCAFMAYQDMINILRLRMPGHDFVRV